MADKKISALTAISVIADNDVLPIVDVSATETKKATVTQIKELAPVQSVASKTGAVTLDKSDVGLSNVDNTADTDKPISTATQTALNAKEATITATTTADYYRGDKTFATLDKAAVGLGNVDNTSDANKPISTATQTALNAKEATITATTTADYYRGDKTFATLDKAAVGLGNVDNTSDANKPISTATQTALDGKVDENAAITGATKTKITYDAKGLVTAGADLSASDLPSGIDAAKLADGSVTNTELQYIGTVTSNVQTQLDAKIAKSDGATYDVNALAAVTQAEYDALTPSATTLYFII